MNNLDFFNLIQNSEAETTFGAFGVDEDRANEIEAHFEKGYNEFSKAIGQNVRLSKTDMFLFISRTGFVAQTPQELIMMALMISERITQAETMTKLSAVIPADLVKKLFTILNMGPGPCNCSKCQKRRAEGEGFDGHDEDEDDEWN